MSARTATARDTEMPMASRSTGGAWWWIAAAVIALAVTAAAATVAPELARHGHPSYAVSGVLMTLSDLLLLLGVVSLSRSGAARSGWAWRVSSVLAVVGSAGAVVAEVLLRFDFQAGTTAFGVVGTLQALGFIGLGLCLAVAGPWGSWRRFTLLALGLYVPAVLVPLMAHTHGQSLAGLAGFHLLVLLTGVAWLLEERRTAPTPA